MSKPVVIVGILLTFVSVSIGLLLFLSYGLETVPPTRDKISGLEEAASIRWAEKGPIHIQVEDRRDFYTALGYAHGMNRTWISLLMRQASLGKMSEWFGQEAWNEDRLVRRLGIAREAQRSYEALSPGIRTRLERYANGMNAALMTKRVQRKAALVLLEIDPGRWEPWHSIAVERLWAWLGAPVQQLDTSVPGVRDLLLADRSLRSRLHIFGMRENMNVLIGGGQQMRHLLRYLMGNSGQPILQEFVFQSTAGTRMDGLSIPGTIIFPAGRTETFSWTFLMAADVSVAQEPVLDLVTSETYYDRLQDVNGFEEVIQIERVNGALAIDEGSATDSLRTLLSWSGMDHATDSESWIGLADGTLRPFALFRDDGIVNKSGVGAAITGSPSTSYRHPNGVLFISNSDSGDDLVERLKEIISGQAEAQSDWDLLHDTFSKSAKNWTDDFLSALDSLPSRTVREDEAVEYLRNWDLSYRGSSIAASIAEYAVQEMRNSSGDPVRAESAGIALREAVDALTSQFSTDMREWRWESVQDLRVYFPGWMSASTNTDRRVRKFQSEFEPVSLAGRGHPTSLSWGPNLDPSRMKAATAWEGLFGSQPGTTFEFERPIVRYAKVLGRFLPENRTPVQVSFTSDSIDNERTELIPAR
ncbi:MAG: penicillin acylase family protein [Rhodothermia bacterium]|nr:MAG: penicillin acylase family protein [Rhodothermia bacterium]